MCTESSGSFDVTAVNTGLCGTMFAGRLHHFAIIDSTQTRALADAAAGAKAGQVYIADEQTAGRGRGGHAWHSEPERGLYMTVLVRPVLNSSEILKLSLATALAAKAALELSAGLTIDLRWPNDLVFPDPGAASRKLGGVLTEAASTPAGEVRHAAIGIGINLNQAEFPQDLRQTATSVRVAVGHAVSRAQVAVALLRQLDSELALLAGTAARPSVFERFTQASTWTVGKRVVVAEGEGYTGLTAGLTHDGLLRVRDDAGELRIVRHGGVREAF